MRTKARTVQPELDSLAQFGLQAVSVFLRLALEVAGELVPLAADVEAVGRVPVVVDRGLGRVGGGQGGPAVCDEAEADDDSLYCIFSCTKAITSAAAWLLIQEGKLSVDERVADIVPEFGSHGKDVIHVEQLFTHTAGFPAAPFDPAVFLDRDGVDSGGVQIVFRQQRRSQITKVIASNTGGMGPLEAFDRFGAAGVENSILADGLV